MSKRILQALVRSAVLVAIATATDWAGRNVLAEADLVMVYLVAIVAAALRFDRSTAVATAVLSVASYDFFFVTPVLTFSVADQRHVLTFAMMFGIGVAFSTLTGRIRDREEAARIAAVRARTEEIRSSLLSSVSHDLRTPLAVITGAGTTLRDGLASVPAAERDELLATICEEAERLERLVGNLLDMTRVESGGLTPKLDWVPLEEPLGSALGRMDKRLLDRAVTTELAEDLPLVLVDPVLVEQVLINLFDNAIKYSPAGTGITVRARPEDPSGRDVVVEIEDGGPGLPPGAEERIFEKFQRGHAGPIGGSGLGLSICRGMIEAMGGTVTAANLARGGAVVRIVLPSGTPVGGGTGAER